MTLSRVLLAKHLKKMKVVPRGVLFNFADNPFGSRSVAVKCQITIHYRRSSNCTCTTKNGVYYCDPIISVRC